MFKAKIFVTLKEGILDPQGKAVKESLSTLGYDEVNSVRIGKFIELDVETKDFSVAEERVKEMCRKLLANTVIEDFTYALEEVKQ